MRTRQKFWLRNSLPQHHRYSPCPPALLLTVAALLAACNEVEPPTSARESDHAAAVAAVQSDVTVQGTIPLPVNQTIASPGVAFGITQTGSGDAGSFTVGTIRSSAQALLATNKGAGAAVFGQVVGTGTGSAGVFSVTNGNNLKPALVVTTFGKGPAGVFTIGSSTGSPALRATTNGIGRAGWFEILNNNNASPALFAQTNGFGTALEAATTGPEAAGLFRSNNGRTGLHVIVSGTGGPAPGAALEVATSAGFAGKFSSLNPNNHFPALLLAASGGNALQVSGTSTFNGNVSVFGTLTKSAGSFRIDHPLDPAHKYLSHSFVESPDMMNVYNGNATLDLQGRVNVELPKWFEALNRDFRYQLTPIGAPAPKLYIAEEVHDNRFRIAGGRPNGRVSWQVTGIRHDAYAEAHRIPVEEEKSAAERARTLQP